MKFIEEQEIADFIGLHTTNVSKKKKNDYQMYEVLRLGSICKKYNITEETLALLVKDNNLNKFERIIEILEEK